MDARISSVAPANVTSLWSSSTRITWSSPKSLGYSSSTVIPSTRVGDRVSNCEGDTAVDDDPYAPPTAAITTRSLASADARDPYVSALSRSKSAADAYARSLARWSHSSQELPA